MGSDKEIIRAYTIDRLSAAQIASLFGRNATAVYRVLDRNKIERRNISDAIRHLNITKFNKAEFVLPDTLNAAQQQLKLAGLMLYWGEGTKKGSGVAFANSDPHMILVFIRFLREVCGINENRLHATIHHYDDHNIEQLLQFWSNLTQISTSQFYRPFLHRNTRGSYKQKSQYGTLSIQYSDKKLLELICSWLEEYKKDLLS